jgi:hypothetical protein
MDDFLRRKLSEKTGPDGKPIIGPDGKPEIDRDKGWIKVNPVEGLGSPDPKREGKLTLPSFDREIDGVDSEYYTPDSIGNLVGMISKKLKHSSHTKEAKRVYINLTGKEGDLNEILTLAWNHVVRPDRPELSNLQIFYRVGEDLFKFTPTP